MEQLPFTVQKIKLRNQNFGKAVSLRLCILPMVEQLCFLN